MRENMPQLLLVLFISSPLSFLPLSPPLLLFYYLSSVYPLCSPPASLPFLHRCVLPLFLFSLVTSQLSIPRMQEVLSSFEVFLQHVSMDQTSQYQFETVSTKLLVSLSPKVHRVGSPLTLDSLYHLLLSEETM